jgi:hypothetical protein
MRLAGWLPAVLFVGGAARAETIVLKDGTFIEGKITLQTSTSVHVDTRFGVRAFARKEIDQIVESIDDSSTASGEDICRSTGSDEGRLERAGGLRLAAL